MRAIDLTGQRFERLTVIERRQHGKVARWLCLCDCGAAKEFAHGNLRNGTSRSCGCLRADALRASKTTHGQRGEPEYAVWGTMKRRCHSPACADFKYYGARGISVCDRWRASFEAFIADMGKRPSDKHSIERVNNDGNYEPSNCVWATVAEQAKNRRHPRASL